MTFATVHSRALRGLEAPEVTVEVHLANGLPSFTLVGLADTEVKESRERVRAALQTSGLEFPHNKRVTVNLAPADLPKESGRFGLPIALGILAAAGQIDAARLDEFEFAGELSLGGELRPVHGALAVGLALRRGAAARGTLRTLVLPKRSAEETALVGGLRVRGAEHLLDVVRALLHGDAADASGLRVPEAVPRSAAAPLPDLREVKGQAAAKRALEIAAAGELSLLMVGPPGTGKSMLAQRLGGLLPALSHEAALESAAILSVASAFSVERWGQRVLRAPHHTASAAALVGGGSPPRPGEASLAHHGVLFLDELPEFPRAALEALREPMETGRIVISRAARQAEFPALFQFVAAMNPCPCGQLATRPEPAAARPTRCCATRRGSAARSSIASTSRSTCPRSRRTSSPAPPMATRALSSASASRWRASERKIARAVPMLSSPARRSICIAGSMPKPRASCKGLRLASAGRRAAFIACCGSRARSPTWPRAATSPRCTSPRRFSIGASCRRSERRAARSAPPRF